MLNVFVDAHQQASLSSPTNNIPELRSVGLPSSYLHRSVSSCYPVLHFEYHYHLPVCRFTLRPPAGARGAL